MSLSCASVISSSASRLRRRSASLSTHASRDNAVFRKELRLKLGCAPLDADDAIPIVSIVLIAISSLDPFPRIDDDNPMN